MISRLQLEENWDTLRTAVQSQWSILGGEELQAARHSPGHFVGLIQQRTGEPREDIERFVESVLSPVPAFLRQSSRHVANSPIAATAIALGAGFVVGVAATALIGSRRD